MCWRISDSTGTNLSITQPDAVHLATSTTSTEYCWIYAKDRQTRTGPSTVVPAFTDSSDGPVTVWSNAGAQYIEDEHDGSITSPGYVYFGAKFLHATTPNKYKTNRIIVEYLEE